MVPLEVEPPRDIPDDERIMRDRKERQLKIKENVRYNNWHSKYLGTERTKRERRA